MRPKVHHVGRNDGRDELDGCCPSVENRPCRHTVVVVVIGPQNTTGMTGQRLPHHSETERAILGTVLVDNTALTVASSVLAACDFFVLAHRRIFSAMQDLAASAKPIEINTLWNILSDDREIIAHGGPAFVSSLGDGAYRNAPINYWAQMVRDAAILRNI